MESNVYDKALAEVYEIFYIIDKKDLEKIPQEFKDFVNENRDKEYIVHIDRSKPLHKQKLLPETFAICALIYRDYLVSPEKRAEIIEKEKEEIIKTEQELRERYNPDNIFKNNNFSNMEEKETSKELVQKENFISKMINKIKQIFKK